MVQDAHHPLSVVTSLPKPGITQQPFLLEATCSRHCHREACRRLCGNTPQWGMDSPGGSWSSSPPRLYRIFHYHNAGDSYPCGTPGRWGTYSRQDSWSSSRQHQGYRGHHHREAVGRLEDLRWAPLQVLLSFFRHALDEALFSPWDHRLLPPISRQEGHQAPGLLRGDAVPCFIQRVAGNVPAGRCILLYTVRYSGRPWGGAGTSLRS
jgi:hypothetical protein